MYIYIYKHCCLSNRHTIRITIASPPAASDVPLPNQKKSLDLTVVADALGMTCMASAAAAIALAMVVASKISAPGPLLAGVMALPG